MDENIRILLKSLKIEAQGWKFMKNECETSIFPLSGSILINKKQKKYAVYIVKKNADVSYWAFPELLSVDSFLGKSSAVFTTGAGASSV